MHALVVDPHSSSILYAGTRQSGICKSTNGDGKAYIAIWQPDTGFWYILPSESPGSYTVKQRGLATDGAISPMHEL